MYSLSLLFVDTFNKFIHLFTYLVYKFSSNNRGNLTSYYYCTYWPIAYIWYFRLWYAYQLHWRRPLLSTVNVTVSPIGHQRQRDSSLEYMATSSTLSLPSLHLSTATHTLPSSSVRESKQWVNVYLLILLSANLFAFLNKNIIFLSDFHYK